VAAAGPSPEANAEALNGQEAATTEYSFDALAKGFAEGKLSRRKALRMLGATLVGGVLASVPGGAWAAKPAPCPSGVKCGKNCCQQPFICSRGKCACPTGTTNLGTTCCSNAQVCGQSCGCSSGEGCCSGACTPLNTDANCGSCGNACPSGQGCVNGQCVGTCPAENLSLCCDCYYSESLPGTFYFTSCHVLRSTTNCHDPQECIAVCEANTPPGMVLAGSGSGSSCNNFAGTNQQHICQPASYPNQTGPLCFIGPCAAGT
jgi:hypothetical protein